MIIVCVHWFELFSQVSDVANGPLVIVKYISFCSKTGEERCYDIRVVNNEKNKTMGIKHLECQYNRAFNSIELPIAILSAKLNRNVIMLCFVSAAGLSKWLTI